MAALPADSDYVHGDESSEDVFANVAFAYQPVIFFPHVGCAVRRCTFWPTLYNGAAAQRLIRMVFTKAMRHVGMLPWVFLPQAPFSCDLRAISASNLANVLPALSRSPSRRPHNTVSVTISSEMPGFSPVGPHRSSQAPADPLHFRISGLLHRLLWAR